MTPPTHDNVRASVRRFDGVTAVDLAEVMDLTTSNERQRLAQALMRLKRQGDLKVVGKHPTALYYYVKTTTFRAKGPRAKQHA